MKLLYGFELKEGGKGGNRELELSCIGGDGFGFGLV